VNGYANTYHKGVGGDTRRDLTIRLENDGSLSIGGHKASRQTPPVSIRHAQIGRLAKKLADDPALQPTPEIGPDGKPVLDKDGNPKLITHCTELARRYAKEGPWNVELEGKDANEVIENLERISAPENSKTTGWSHLGLSADAKKNMVEVQDAANAEKLCFAAKPHDPNGHIVPIVPIRSDSKMEVRQWEEGQPYIPVPMCTQAGTNNFDYKPLTNSWRLTDRDGVHFYCYTPPQP
jgi:hypothetical protein